MGNIKKIAIFWDKSFLWGLIAYDTFQRLSIDFELLSAEEIRNGALDGRELLFVPGGWASDKIVALGDEGREAVRGFVSAGGSYLGFCGGAGLALSHESGLGLAPFGRVPTRERLPSFSGRISLRRDEPNHDAWQAVDEKAAFHAWWPGQFAIDDDAGVRVIASYGDPQDGSYVTDLPIGPDYDWKEWEDAYGINLDPGLIVGEPAVVETTFGEGRIILSYLHFETPHDGKGNIVLLNLLDYLTRSDPWYASSDELLGGWSIFTAPDTRASRTGDAAIIARETADAAGAFIELGARHFLWYRRNDWLLQWRRGVRGIEYSTLAAMLGQIARLVTDDTVDDLLLDRLRELQARVASFLDDARKLIMLERFAMLNGPISPLKTGDAEIRALRDKLFSTSKRCGGEYEQIVSLADDILLPLLKTESAL